MRNKNGVQSAVIGPFDKWFLGLPCHIEMSAQSPAQPRAMEHAPNHLEWSGVYWTYFYSSSSIQLLTCDLGSADAYRISRRIHVITAFVRPSGC